MSVEIVSCADPLADEDGPEQDGAGDHEDLERGGRGASDWVDLVESSENQWDAQQEAEREIPGEQCQKEFDQIHEFLCFIALDIGRIAMELPRF